MEVSQKTVERRENGSNLLKFEESSLKMKGNIQVLQKQKIVTLKNPDWGNRSKNSSKFFISWLTPTLYIQICTFIWKTASFKIVIGYMKCQPSRCWHASGSGKRRKKTEWVTCLHNHSLAVVVSRMEIEAPHMVCQSNHGQLRITCFTELWPYVLYLNSGPASFKGPGFCSL